MVRIERVLHYTVQRKCSPVVHGCDSAGSIPMTWNESLKPFKASLQEQDVRGRVPGVRCQVCRKDSRLSPGPEEVEQELGGMSPEDPEEELRMALAYAGNTRRQLREISLRWQVTSA